MSKDSYVEANAELKRAAEDAAIWTPIERADGSATDALQVPGGFLVSQAEFSSTTGEVVAVAMVFVPNTAGTDAWDRYLRRQERYRAAKLRVAEESRRES